MTHPIDPDGFGFVVTDLSRLIRAEMDRRVAEAGLGITAGEARVLSHAVRAGAVRQNVLAERVGIEAMTLSTYIDRLEARGFVVRKTDPADRRAKLVEITPEADTVLAAIRPIAAAVRADAARSIAPQDWDRLNAALKIVRANLTDLRIADREEAAA